MSDYLFHSSRCESAMTTKLKIHKFCKVKSFEVGNIGGTQGQLSGSIMDPLTSPIAYSKNEESCIVHGDGFSGLSSDSNLSIAEVVPQVLPEKEYIYAGENMHFCGF